MRLPGSHEVKPLSNASEVYVQFRKEGLMLRRDGTGRDDALWRELVTKLGFEGTIRNLADALKGSRTSVEDFVRAFLTCFEPFARMMAEICLFMQKIDAKKGYHGLKINYRFSDRDESVEFDLKHFREFWRRYATLYERAVYQLWSLYDVRQYVADIARHLTAYPKSAIQEQEKGVTWEPGSAVPDDFQRNATLVSNARVVHSLYRSIDRARWPATIADLGESLLTATDHDDGDPLVGLLRHQEVSVGSPPTKNDLDQIRELLTQAHRDLARINACLSENKTPILSFHSDYRFSAANSLEVILSHYDDLPTEERLRTTLVEQLAEILNLPVWKHRWQLYQVWVGFSVLHAFDDAGVTVTVHAPEGKLELHERHPAELAGITECRTPITYWAELETLLPQVTEGSRSIKPDYRLARSPSTSPGNTILLVEAKQYERMAIKDLIKLHARYGQDALTGSSSLSTTTRFRLVRSLVRIRTHPSFSNSDRETLPPTRHSLKSSVP